MGTWLLNRVSNIVSVEVKLKAYKALIYSKLIYGILSWGKCCKPGYNKCNFVDDITVFLSHPNYDALYVSFNEELCKVS